MRPPRWPRAFAGRRRWSTQPWPRWRAAARSRRRRARSRGDEPDGSPSAVRFFDDYGKRLALRGEEDAEELLRSTRVHWESKGYTVSTRNLSSRVPSVRAEAAGFNLSLQVARDKALAELGASTPCLPR